MNGTAYPGGSPQAAWAAALVDPSLPPPPGLRAWNGSDPARRFDVHRNNVVVSLVDALADTFPVVQALVGEDFFRAMARLFVPRHPPRSPLLAEYGARLPAFIEAFAPTAGLPYLADVARLEFARVQAYHAADAPVLRRQPLAARLAEPEALPAARWRLHPSVHLVASRHPVVALWAAHQGLGELADVDLAQPQAALVLRKHDDVVVLALAPGAAGFVQALAAGATLAEAAAAAATGIEGQDFDLAATLALLIDQGALSEWLAPQSAAR